MMKSIGGTEVRVLWSCRTRCVELLQLGVQEMSGYFRPFRYEVHIFGESVLYKSQSEHAAMDYLQMLLGSSSDELELRNMDLSFCC